MLAREQLHKLFVLCVLLENKIINQILWKKNLPLIAGYFRGT